LYPTPLQGDSMILFPARQRSRTQPRGEMVVTRDAV
jgi:hypothetical protein